MTRSPSHPFPRSRSSRRAFTLVEMIVATIMLAILVVCTYTAVGQIIRTRDHAIARSSAFQRANLAADLIATDAQQALRDANLLYCRVAIIHPTATGSAQSRGSDGLLLFSHISRPIRPFSGQNEGSECESQYRLEPAAGSVGSTLWHRAQPVPDDKPDAGGVATALFDGMVSLNFEAFDGSAWTNTWDSDNDGFPYALRINVVASDDSGKTTTTARRVVPFDRIPIPWSSQTTTSQSTTPNAPPGTSTGTTGSGGN